MQEALSEEQDNGTRYKATPKGILELALSRAMNVRFGDCGDAIDAALETLELHMRRFYQKEDGCAAIILEEDGKLHFATVNRAD